MKKLIVLSIFLVCANIKFGLAQNNSGLAFLKIDTDARAASMAGSYTALTNDASAAFYNPAGLNLAESQSFLAMYNDWFWDLSHSYAAIQIANGEHSLALSFNYQQSPGVEIRDEQPTEKPAGTTDPFYFAAAISYATTCYNEWNVGLTAKYLFEKSYLNSAPGIAFDFGIIKEEIFDFTDFGFAVHNLGKMAALKNESTPLPLMIQTGLALKLPDLYGESFVFTPGIQWIKSEKTYLKMGMEFHLNEYIHLRGGLKNGNEDILWATGFGLNFGKVNVDYAYAPLDYNLGTSNRISLRFKY